MRGGLFFRQADQDARAAALVDRAGGGDPPAHGFDEALGDGKTQPRAGAGRPVAALFQPLEALEHLLQLGGRYAPALVLDADDDVALVLIDRGLDARSVV